MHAAMAAGVRVPRERPGEVPKRGHRPLRTASPKNKRRPRDAAGSARGIGLTT
jgi:hypothetical protein